MFLTTFFYGVHGIQFGSEVSPNEIGHGMGCREFVDPREQRPLDLSFRLGLRFWGEGLAVWLCVAGSRARQDGRGRVTEAAIVFATFHFVFKFGKRRAGLLLHGEVEHAGSHVVPHELDAHLDAASFFPLLPRLRLQGIPARK